jgi:hypothetical protein
MIELLDAWLTLRGDPPWQFDIAKVKTEDIDDCEYQIEQLKALEARLEGLTSPVCELPLQGVRSDRRRLEIVLQQFRGRIL